MLRWMADAPDMQAPDSATACIRIAASVMPSPAPPYSSGIAMPSQLPAAMAAKKVSGKVAVWSRSSQYPSSNRPQSFSTSSRICCCASVRAKSIAGLSEQPCVSHISPMSSNVLNTRDHAKEGA